MLGRMKPVMTLLIFHYMDVYPPWRGQSYVNHLRAISAAWLTEAGLVMFLLFVFKHGQYFSRFVLLVWFTVTPMILFLVHVTIHKMLCLIRARGKNQRSAVIVGAGDLGVSLARYIEEIPWFGIRVIGYFDDRKTTADLAHTRQKEKTVLGTVSELKDYLENNDVDFVYIALPMRAEKKIHDILKNCRTQRARLYLVPDLYAFRIFNTRLQRLGSVMLLDFNPESDRKRLFDVLFSLLVIFATLPLTLLIALLIKLNDWGPIFYGHRRIMVSGKEFSCLKFRTMRVDADKKLKKILENDPEARKEWEQTFKLKNDPRVTRVGYFLRKTSLDELPQFINVLKGEMSVVGARPIVQQELCDYYKENGGIYCSIKPGITGPWQVGKRSDAEDYQERVELDTWYVVNRNFWLDMKIICQTVVKILRGSGAY
jgi:exopolysaccharide biosynthesis polyprenyl glycosylphosphotransferase